MQEYFKEVEEESIRDNFVICYELLDELVDFGYPQTTDAKILQEYITQVAIEANNPIKRNYDLNIDFSFKCVIFLIQHFYELILKSVYFFEEGM